MRRSASGLALFSLLAVGCATPAPVRQLASESARNVSLVNTQLRAFAQDSERIAVERAAIIRELDARVTDAEKELASKIEALQLVNDRGRLKLFQDLDGLLGVLAGVQRLATEREAALRKQIEVSRSPLAPPVNTLTTAEGRLLELGKEDAGLDRVRFYATFLGEVVRDVQEAAKAQGEAGRKTVDGARAASAEREAALLRNPAELKP